MSNVATSLLDFILDLLSDPEAAADFQDDPEAALEDAGLGDLCAADVDAILPMLADYAPVGRGGSSHNRDDDEDDDKSSGHRPSHGHKDDDDEDDDNGHGHRPDHGHKDDDDDHDGYLAIEHIKHIQNHYTYSPTTTIDASHSVWGDSYKIWAEDDAVVAVDGAVAIGGDVEDSDIDVDNSVRDSYNDVDVEGDGNAIGRDSEVTNEDSFNTEIDLENVGNTNNQDGTGNVIGDENDVDNDVDNSSVEVDIEDVNLALGDGSVAGGSDVNTANNSLGTVQDVEVDIEDSFNEDNSTDVDVELEDSFNEDNSTNVELEDSFNEENSLEIEESFNENAVAVDEALAIAGGVDD
jgi:hypothetical protein